MARTHPFHRTRFAAAITAVSLGFASFGVGLSAAPTAVAAPAAPAPVTGINAPQTWGADLQDPVALTTLHGQIWFADQGSYIAPGVENAGSIGRITSAGYVENYPTEDQPTSITVGPDHNLWFGLDGGLIGRMTPSGKTKYFGLNGIAYGTDVTDITPGPGGLWFDGGSEEDGSTTGAFVGRITTKGKISIYNSKAFFTPTSIVAANGSVWILDTGGETNVPSTVDPYVLKLTNGKPNGRFRTTALTNAPDDQAMTEGPDGALWIASDHVLRLSTAGKWTKYGSSKLTAQNSIVVGPDKKLWFGVSNSHVGVMSTSGHLTYHRGTDGPLAFGADQTLWAGLQDRNGNGNGNGNGLEKISTKSSAHRTFQGGIDNPTALVTGPDKSLWFTNDLNDDIGRFVPGKGAVFYASRKVDQPTGLVVGPDKGLWFTNTGSNTIGRIGSATHKITAYHGTGIKAPWGITVGADKALWFTNNGNNSIGRITTAGKVTNYPGGTDTKQPEGITKGPDGALWYASNGNDAINRMDPSTHVVTSYPGIFGPTELISAQGYLWAINAGDELYRISTSGAEAHRQLRFSVNQLEGLAADKAGRIWFAWLGENNDSTGIRSPGGVGVRATSTKLIYRTTGGYADFETAITQGPGSAMWATSGFWNTISSFTPKS